MTHPHIVNLQFPLDFIRNPPPFLAHPATGALAEGLEAQAEQVFTNIANLLEAAGSDMGHVVKTTVFIKDMDKFGEINEIYEEFFKAPYPARSCVEVARLPKDVLIEIEAVAER